MRAWILRLVALSSIAALSCWAWRVFFPSTEEVLCRRLTELAKVVSIDPNEGALTKLSKTQKISSFFDDGAQVTVDIPGRTSQMLSSREEIQNAFGYARSMLNSLKVNFVDVIVQVDADKQSALAHLTATADLPGEKLPEVQELSVSFKKVGPDWLINRVETVKTLK